LKLEILTERLLLEYLTYGGIPLILSMRTHEAKSNFLYNLFIETYLKDIINRNNLTNSDELKELVNIVSSSIGSLTNPTKLSNTFKSVKNVNLSIPTISKYLEHLTDSFLIHKAIR
jgi:predicted AAA+ superfamily ATPase